MYIYLFLVRFIKSLFLKISIILFIQFLLKKSCCLLFVLTCFYINKLILTIKNLLNYLFNLIPRSQIIQAYDKEFIWH